MEREERDEQIWLYAAGALGEAEMQSVRALLEAGDAEDLASLASARETLARLPESLPPSEPSEAVLNRLMRRASTPPRSNAKSVSPPSPRRIIWPTLVAAAAALVAVVSVLSALRLNSEAKQAQVQLDQALATLESSRTQTAREIQQLKNEMEAQRVASAKQMDAILAQTRLLFQPNLQFTALQGQDLPKGGGRVVWDKDNRKSHVFVFDLAPPADGKVYELWFIGPDGKPIPAGTFTVDASGKGQLDSPVPDGMNEIKVAAITEEPAGGSLAPTSPIKLMGQVQ